MHRISAFIVTAMIVLAGSITFAGTIYTWTDADGVKRYSNSPPPEDVEQYETINELQGDQEAEGRKREEYDRMVQEAGQAADRHFEQQAEEKAKAAQAERDRKMETQASRIAAERERLEKEIAAINGRALGPNFSPGQKAALIERVQEKINHLERDPDNYFNR
ncbi:DUF4124 domain-containing protein [Desulfosarcina ovata]|uniref:DUF4124 domain-containing protein n=1 Tax=Desulfosarcina ovata subsp. ovata TaxID=2752305 RepID=A0A5K8ACB9_9BACT|nr:DUF4124 domain-containing protein [Desulfosarcina ovata]BBO90108.1 hypothetical protein DSCOOX_32880 [Desulfosarcina ovata subsp. ovata]